MQTMQKESDPKIKFKVQRAVALFSFFIFAGKLIAYFLTNSVGILTDALESTVNVITGFISLYALYISLKPKDENHPFGHGKAEFLSASLEGFLILLAGLIIIFEAVKRLFVPVEINQLDVGIYIVAIAGLLNFLIGRYSILIGKKNNSIALISGGKHLQSDTYSSIGLLLGLALLYFTKLAWLDSVVALIFGLIIIITGYKILRETAAGLMDEADFKTIERFGKIISENRTTELIDIHNFKLIKYGDTFHINFDMVLPYNMNIAEAHKEGDKLKKVWEKTFSENLIFNIHTDECKKIYCKNCNSKQCIERTEPFKEFIELNIENLTKEQNKL